MTDAVLGDPKDPRRRAEPNDRTFRGLPLGSVIGNLPEMILAHFVSDRRVAILIEVGRDRYVQFLATEDQHLVVECVSNHFLEGDEELSVDDEFNLIEAGFELPESDEDPRPNWWWHTESASDVMMACRMAALVLRGVFRLTDDDRVVLVERPLEVPS